jgi:hypothetical protein
MSRTRIAGIEIDRLTLSDAIEGSLHSRVPATGTSW